MAKSSEYTHEESEEHAVLAKLIEARAEGLGGMNLSSLSKSLGMSGEQVKQRLNISIKEKLVRKTGSVYHCTPKCPG